MNDISIITTKIGNSTYYESSNNQTLCGLKAYDDQSIINNENENYTQVIEGEINIVFVDAAAKSLSMCLQVGKGDKLGVITLHKKDSFNDYAMDKLLTRHSAIHMFIETSDGDKTYFMMSPNSKCMGTIADIARSSVLAKRFDYMDLDINTLLFVKRIFPDPHRTLVVIGEKP